MCAFTGIMVTLSFHHRIEAEQVEAEQWHNLSPTLLPPQSNFADRLCFLLLIRDQWLPNWHSCSSKPAWMNFVQSRRSAS